MGLEVYYPGDIRNALLAAEQASGGALRATGGDADPFVAGYGEGYRDALATLALAFGLIGPQPIAKRRWNSLARPGPIGASPERR